MPDLLTLRGRNALSEFRLKKLTQALKRTAPAITAMGVKAVLQGLTTCIGELVDYDLNRITPEVICTAGRQGDAVALDILDRTGSYLGIGIANILVSLTPEIVVIAGGVSRAFDLLQASIQREISNRVFVTSLKDVKIVPAALGNQAGVIGVAVWVSQA